MRKIEEDQGTKLIRAMAQILIGGVVALAVCLLFLLGCSIAVSAGWLQEAFMAQLTIVGCVLGGFAGGSYAVRRCRTRTLLVGLAVGGILFLLQITIGVLAFGEIAVEREGLGLLCGTLCGGAAAGILGGRPKKKRRK